MTAVLVALFVALVGASNDSQDMAGCFETARQAQAIEIAYGVDLYVHEDCSVEVVDN
jgi:hypothetical protein